MASKSRGQSTRPASSRPYEGGSARRQTFINRTGGRGSGSVEGYCCRSRVHERTIRHSGSQMGQDTLLKPTQRTAVGEGTIQVNHGT